MTGFFEGMRKNILHIFWALVLTVFIHYSLHGKTMAEVTADGSGRISDEEKRKNEDINLTVLE